MAILTTLAVCSCTFIIQALGAFNSNPYLYNQLRRPLPYDRVQYPGYGYNPVDSFPRASQGQRSLDPQGRPEDRRDRMRQGEPQQGMPVGPRNQVGRQDVTVPRKPFVRQSNPPDAVAFTGNRRTDQYFFQRGPVIFNDVITNIGGGYNGDYGVFTAPESGIYLISYNIVSPRKGSKTASADLYRNNDVINSASGSGASGETSNSAVLFLNKYDQLSVQGRPESAIYCGVGGNDAFCSFSVTLVKLGVFSDSDSPRPVPGW